MKTKIITVTQKDIDSPIINRRLDCPVAKAINRAFKEKMGFASVGRTSIVLRAGDRYSLCKEASDFINRFDGEEEVEPFTFTLRY